MKKTLILLSLAAVCGCGKDVAEKGVSSDVLAVFDGVCLSRARLQEQVDYRMGLFEVNRRLNLAMRKMDLAKIQAQQAQKLQKRAQREVLFKALLAAGADKAGIEASAENRARIRSQYEQMLGRKEGSYSLVTSTVDRVGFLPKFEKALEEEARSLTYVMSLNPGVSMDVTEADIDAYAKRLCEKEARIAAKNAETYQTATNLLKRLKAGEDFAKLAREYSSVEDKEEGGDMGEVILTGEQAYCNYAPAYTQALMMQDGALSEVVTTPLGVEIFQIVSHAYDQKPDEPIIKNIRHICLELWQSVPPYTRDSVRRRILSDRIKELYSEKTVMRVLDTVSAEIVGEPDARAYFKRGFAVAEEQK